MSYSTVDVVEEDVGPLGDDQVTLGDDELSVLQAALDRRSRAWRSRAYEFFDSPRIVLYHGGVAQAFTCLKCNRVLHRMQDTLDSTSTSNLLAHLKACMKPDEFEAAITAHNSGEEFSKKPFSDDEMRLAVVRWIAQDLRPIAIVEDRGFLRIVKAGRPGTWVPSSQTVIRDLNTVYHQAFDNICDVLVSTEHQVHITSDAWTSPNQLSFVAFFVHYAVEGKIQHFLLDIIDVAQSHTGSHLARVLHALLNRYGLTDKFMGTTLDNASNNTAMVNTLQRLLPTFKGKQAHGNCFAHILNLVAKAFTSSFEKRVAVDADEEAIQLPTYALDEVETMDEVDGTDIDADLAPLLLPIDEESEDDASSEDPEDDEDRLRAQAAAIAVSLSKIRKISIKISGSPTLLRPAWFSILADLDLRARKIPRDVPTRWNSTYALLRFAILYQPAIDKITLHRDLQDFMLSLDEWELLRKLRNALKAFYAATEFFSRADFPGICYVLRCVYTLDRVLEDLILNGGDPTLQAAARLARAKLHKYKRILISKEIYQFATVFHPRRKLQFFQSRAEFSQAWVCDLSERMADVFANEYLPDTPPQSSEQPERSPTFAEEMFGESPVKPAAVRRRGATGSAPAAATVANTTTELDRYLNAPPEATDDVIAWWYNRRDQYPNLYRMAIDYCSVPATTVDVERLFSTGRMLLSYLRNRLSADSVHSILSLKSWWDANVISDNMFTL